MKNLPHYTQKSVQRKYEAFANPHLRRILGYCPPVWPSIGYVCTRARRIGRQTGLWHKPIQKPAETVKCRLFLII